jgi:hypothetical protein
MLSVKDRIENLNHCGQRVATVQKRSDFLQLVAKHTTKNNLLLGVHFALCELSRAAAPAKH